MSSSSTLSTPPSSNLRSRTRGTSSKASPAPRPDSIHSSGTARASPEFDSSRSSRGAAQSTGTFKPTNPHGGPARHALYRIDPRYVGWRLNMWAQASFSGGMLETWEKALLATFLLSISLLVWYSAFHYLPTHASIMIRRAYYYLFGPSLSGAPDTLSRTAMERARTEVVRVGGQVVEEGTKRAGEMVR